MVRDAEGQDVSSPLIQVGKRNSVSSPYIQVSKRNSAVTFPRSSRNRAGKTSLARPLHRLTSDTAPTQQQPTPNGQFIYTLHVHSGCLG